MEIYITHIDSACVLIDINGFKIVTDPTLDEAGHWYHHGFGAVSRKTDNPALPADSPLKADLVLLSHHQHKDNLDNKGLEFMKTVPLVFSTKDASKHLPGVIGMEPWETRHVATGKVPGLRITATPAQHRPSWLPEFISGKVIGFVIAYEGQEQGVIYISGDTVYFDGLAKVAERFKIDVALFHVGAVQFRYLTGFGHYTMDARGLIHTVKIMQPRLVIPVHHRGWSHFKENPDQLRRLLLEDPSTCDKTLFLVSGQRYRLS